MGWITGLIPNAAPGGGQGAHRALPARGDRSPLVAFASLRGLRLGAHYRPSLAEPPGPSSPRGSGTGGVHRGTSAHTGSPEARGRLCGHRPAPWLHRCPPPRLSRRRPHAQGDVDVRARPQPAGDPPPRGPSQESDRLWTFTQWGPQQRGKSRPATHVHGQNRPPVTRVTHGWEALMGAGPGSLRGSRMFSILGWAGVIPVSTYMKRCRTILSRFPHLLYVSFTSTKK